MSEAKEMRSLIKQTVNTYIQNKLPGFSSFTRIYSDTIISFLHNLFQMYLTWNNFKITPILLHIIHCYRYTSSASFSYQAYVGAWTPNPKRELKLSLFVFGVWRNPLLLRLQTGLLCQLQMMDEKGVMLE